MKALIFDLDDTLYDQIQPFQRALERHMSVPAGRLDQLYLDFRKRADEVFQAAATGKMSLQDSHIYRMKQALADNGYQVSDALALTIQIDYDYFQGQLELSPIFPEIFATCQSNGIALGIITNGPHRHQLRKIRTMQLGQWIESDHIIISGQVGVTKPHPTIFKLLEERLELPASDIVYLGDSFENDVIGAKRAGWQAVWFNHRKRQAPQSSCQADYMIDEWAQLAPLIKKIVKPVE